MMDPCACCAVERTRKRSPQGELDPSFGQKAHNFPTAIRETFIIDSPSPWESSRKKTKIPAGDAV